MLPLVRIPIGQRMTYHDEFDLILNRVSGFSEIDVASSLSILKMDGTFMGLGVGKLEEVMIVSPFSMVSNSASIKAPVFESGSEALDFRISNKEGY